MGIDPAKSETFLKLQISATVHFLTSVQQVFVSRQFSSLRFTLPGGLPGPGGKRKYGTPSANAPETDQFSDISPK